MKSLVRALGIVNLLFTALHIWLVQWINALPGIEPNVHAIMKMLNNAVAGFFFFLAVAMLLATEEILETRLGRMIMAIASVSLIVRAVEEAPLVTAPRPLILAACLIAGTLHAVVLLRTLRPSRCAHGCCCCHEGDTPADGAR